MLADALLKDRRVLVVEDEYMLADAMERNLRRAGAVVLGPVPSLEQALALVAREDDIHGAVLDINLGEQRVYPVVDLLMARGTQCIFATGNDHADVPEAYAHLTRCEKPVDPACIIWALTGSGTRPDIGGSDRLRQVTLERMRTQLAQQIETASDLGQTLLAAKLCEALDVVDQVIED